MSVEAFLDDYETPRIVPLGTSLYAAQFRLMKLLPARFMLDRAQEQGLLKRGGYVVETSSGTFGLALAMLSAIRGFGLTIISATSLMDEAFRMRLEQLGASACLVEDEEGTGNQTGRLEALQTVLKEKPQAFWPRQYDNPDNPASYSRLAEILTEKIGRIDCLVGCVGSGGSLCGTATYLRRLFPALRTVAIDTHNSVLFGHEAGPRMLRGLGNSIVPKNLDHGLIDEVHWVGAFQAFAATRELYRRHAMFMGPTSGAAALVGGWYARHHPEESTVVILPDEGHRYQQTVYSDAWLTSRDGWPPTERIEPVDVTEVTPAGEGDWVRMTWGRSELQNRSGENEAASDRNDGPL